MNSPIAAIDYRIKELKRNLDTFEEHYTKTDYVVIDMEARIDELESFRGYLLMVTDTHTL